MVTYRDVSRRISGRGPGSVTGVRGRVSYGVGGWAGTDPYRTSVFLSSSTSVSESEVEDEKDVWRTDSRGVLVSHCRRRGYGHTSRDPFLASKSRESTTTTGLECLLHFPRVFLGH